MLLYAVAAVLLFAWGAALVRWGWKGFIGLPILLIAFGYWRGCLAYNDGTVKIDLGDEPIKVETPSVPSVPSVNL